MSLSDCPNLFFDRKFAKLIWLGSSVSGIFIKKCTLSAAENDVEMFCFLQATLNQVFSSYLGALQNTEIHLTHCFFF